MTASTPDIVWNERPVKTWQQFIRRIRPRGCNMLKRLPDFPNAILVAGCQRSGTTLLSRILTNSDTMTNFWFTRDEELDAALILSGVAGYQGSGRHCFQTTYLDECWPDYLDHKGNFKLIWVLRNPYSTIYSMLNNWRRFALNDLFQGVGTQLLDQTSLTRYRLFGTWSISKLKRACLSYAAKSSQLFELHAALGPKNIFVLDYDTLINNKIAALTAIYDFVGLEFKNKYADIIHEKSLSTASKLSCGQKAMIDKTALPVYNQICELSNI